MERTFFIGDIHGCFKTFRKLVVDEIGIRKTDRIICIGDYIDRGPDSKGVVDFIIELRENHFNIDTLRGNHEQMLLDSENGMNDYSLWLMNGGEETLKSFKTDSIHNLDPVYIEFFSHTRFFISAKEFLAVHAGLDFEADDPLGEQEAMLWIRNFRVNHDYLDGRLLIHGHTPMRRDYIRSQKFRGPFNIDGGCVYRDMEGMGNLFALDFYAKRLLEVRNMD